MRRWIHRHAQGQLVLRLVHDLRVAPILGPVMAALYRHETEEALRICPGCGRAVRHYDAMCMRCGTDLEYPEDSELIEPHPSMRVRARL